MLSALTSQSYFSSIFFDRLLSFRKECCKDPINQLGFCKEAQTADHILTLDTCIQKYVKKSRKRLYTCFVDFQKAFNSVSREALLFKLYEMGARGKYLKVMRSMYSSSKARIKMLGKISEKIDILIGTEQGHPMSPELFKLYVLELSNDLNKQIGDIEAPTLNNVPILHLLWADDLVLMALNKDSLQKLLHALENFYRNWGLPVNLSKTEVMVFNNAGCILQESHGFAFEGNPLKSVKEYTYLGITMTLTGSYKVATSNLRKKALRGYFALRKMVDWRYLKHTSIIKLMECLVRPILMYACQVWLPYLSGSDLLNLCKNLPTRFSGSSYENTHLTMLKWILGVGKNTSNIGVWGDTGKYPLAITSIKQVIDYYERISAEPGGEDSEPSLVHHAIKEQKTLRLPWQQAIEEIKVRFTDGSHEDAIPISSLSTNRVALGKLIRERMQSLFRSHWVKQKGLNGKLGFYNSIKANFGEEPYLQLTQKPYEKAKNVARIRMSSHKLHIETGRYQQKPRSHRYCRGCVTGNQETIEALLELPFLELHIETEDHVLRSCESYASLRSELPEEMVNVLRDDVSILFSSKEPLHLAPKYISKVLCLHDKIVKTSEQLWHSKE